MRRFVIASPNIENTKRDRKLMNLMSLELTKKQFQQVSKLVHRICGINLKTGKEALVRARLMKRLRALGMSSFNEYFAYLKSREGANELGYMVDVITTNKTSFFREPAHFNYLRDKILPELNGNRLRFWTAACSSGEEPFSLGIVLRENIPDIDIRDVRILGTDISRRMLEKARNAVYGKDAVGDLPKYLLDKYFAKVETGHGPEYKVRDNVRNMVRLAWLNLMDSWPMKGPFNVIFCRNVMIYFDRATQQKLINRFWELLAPDGHLFVGHSEGLSAISHNFKYVRPAVYRK